MTRDARWVRRFSRRTVLRALAAGGTGIGGLAGTRQAAARDKCGWFVPNAYADGAFEHPFSLHSETREPDAAPCKPTLPRDGEYVQFSVTAVADWDRGPRAGGALLVPAEDAPELETAEPRYEFVDVLAECGECLLVAYRARE